MKLPKIYASKSLRQAVLADARALGIAEKWAETIANKTVDHVNKWIKNRGAVTESDIRRVAYKKLQELNPDIAYIYKNRDKIL